MDAALQDFLGSTPSMEIPKPESQPADMQEQQEKASEVVQEQASETVPEQVDETPQVVRRISGKQRRALQGNIPSRSGHRRPQARVPQPPHARRP